MQGVFIGDRRIGTVSKFIGNKAGEQQRFARQREAMAWLQARDAEEKN